MSMKNKYYYDNNFDHRLYFIKVKDYRTLDILLHQHLQTFTDIDAVRISADGRVIAFHENWVGSFVYSCNANYPSS